jgi:hypothetical protein
MAVRSEVVASMVLGRRFDPAASRAGMGRREEGVMGAVRELLRELVPVLVLGLVMACVVAPVAGLFVWLGEPPVDVVGVSLVAWAPMTVFACMWAFGGRYEQSSRWEEAKARAEKKAAQRGDLSGVG